MSYTIKRATKEDILVQSPDIEKALLRNNCFIAKVKDQLIAIANFEFVNPTNVAMEIDDLIEHDDKVITQLLMDEFLWYNPYVKQIKFENEIYHNPNSCELFRIEIDKLTPGQLTVSEDKLNHVKTWVNTSEDIIVDVVTLDQDQNILQVCDGHTRLVLAQLLGIKEVYIFKNDMVNPDFHHEIATWCKEENVLTIKDLTKRIVSAKQHQELWIDRCQAYLKKN